MLFSLLSWECSRFGDAKSLTIHVIQVRFGFGYSFAWKVDFVTQVEARELDDWFQVQDQALTNGF